MARQRKPRRPTAQEAPRLTTVLKQHGHIMHAQVYNPEGGCVAMFAYVPSNTAIQALAMVFEALAGRQTREAPVFRVLEGGRGRSRDANGGVQKPGISNPPHRGAPKKRRKNGVRAVHSAARRESEVVE